MAAGSSAYEKDFCDVLRIHEPHVFSEAVLRDRDGERIDRDHEYHGCAHNPVVKPPSLGTDVDSSEASHEKCHNGKREEDYTDNPD